jgi:hypothetical protein
VFDAFRAHFIFTLFISSILILISLCCFVVVGTDRISDGQSSITDDVKQLQGMVVHFAEVPLDFLFS